MITCSAYNKKKQGLCSNKAIVRIYLPCCTDHDLVHVWCNGHILNAAKVFGGRWPRGTELERIGQK